MKLYIPGALCMMLLLSGCTTITFVNGKKMPSEQTTSRWHHNFAHGLYEGSKPVVLKETCTDREWQRVTTQVSIENSLAGGAINKLVPYVELWSPKTVEITCEKVAAPEDGLGTGETD